MKIAFCATALALLGTGSLADSVKYNLDPSHSQIVFSYDHIGFSTTYGMFSGFAGEINFDETDPATSSVSVSMQARSMITGWEARLGHFMSPDFFDAADDEMVSFRSTSIEVTGENTALIIGDLSLNGVTKSVTLDAKLNKADTHPMANKRWLGFDATTELKRSDYGLGAFAPVISDKVDVKISLEAMIDE